MQEPRLFQIFIDKLNNLQIPYMVTGSVASIVYGEPRLTHDIDIVLTFPLNFIDKFCSSFPDSDFYCPPKDIIRDEILRENRGIVILFITNLVLKRIFILPAMITFNIGHLKILKYLNSIKSKYLLLLRNMLL